MRNQSLFFIFLSFTLRTGHLLMKLKDLHSLVVGCALPPHPARSPSPQGIGPGLGGTRLTCCQKLSAPSSFSCHTFSCHLLSLNENSLVARLHGPRGDHFR